MIKRTFSGKSKPGGAAGFFGGFFFAFLLLAAGIAAAGIYFFQGQKHRLEAGYKRDLAAIAALKSHEIEMWRYERLGDAVALSGNPFLAAQAARFIANPRLTGLASELGTFLSKLCDVYRYRSAWLLDPDGRVLIRRGGRPDEPPGEQALRRAQAIGKTGIAALGDLEEAASDGAVHIDVFVPLSPPSPTGPAVGTIVLRSDPADFLYPLIQTWPTPSRSAETLLVRREGQDVLYLNELRHRRNTALHLRMSGGDVNLPAAMAVRGTEGEVEGMDYRGVPVLSAIRRIPDSPWFLIAKVDLAEIRAPLRREGFLMASLCLVLIAAAGLGLSWLERRERAEYHRRAEAEIQKRNEVLRGVQESTEALIFSLDRDFRYTSFNSGHAAAMKALYGKDIRPGMWFYDAMTVAEDRKAARANLERVLRGESITDESFSGDDELFRRYFQVTHNPIRSEAGDIVGVVVVSRDITARKSVEEAVRRLNADLERRVTERTAQLEAANAELEAFSYSVSHDLRAPLRIIDGFSQAVLEEQDRSLNEEGRVFLRRIRANVQAMGNLIDDMLNLARVTKADLRVEDVDLSRLAESAAAALAGAWPQRTVDVVIAPGLTARGDVRLLQAALENLIENAWKFTSKRSDARIEFGSEAVEGTTAFFVRDNGVGFDMAYAGKLFAPFQRLHAKDEFPGTGVGLATVQRIVRRHGGRVWAEGVVDQGAVFYFTLDIGKERRHE
ncbi:MAG: ATP-binding protein [Candidatus Aminicenantes bacterium]|nr:ATP-binding protein [Candidatus Aminicenantes bacterium]